MANSALGSQTFTALALPSGVMMDYAGTSAPTGWLMCDGRAVLRSAYPELFLSIGTSYGVGDGVTTFNLPDFRGRFTRYNDNMGTVAGAAGRDVGRVHGSTQGQAVKASDLTAGSSSVSGSLTMAKNQMNTDQPGHKHFFGPLFRDSAFADNNMPPRGSNSPISGNAQTDNSWILWSDGANATGSISGTAVAQTISGGTETRPINLSCNKIIKI